MTRIFRSGSLFLNSGLCNTVLYVRPRVPGSTPLDRHSVCYVEAPQRHGVRETCDRSRVLYITMFDGWIHYLTTLFLMNRLCGVRYDEKGYGDVDCISLSQVGLSICSVFSCVYTLECNHQRICRSVG